MVVTPAKAGVQNFLNFLDSRFHGNDRKRHFLTFYEAVSFGIAILEAPYAFFIPGGALYAMDHLRKTLFGV
jgi:hypothetical protein